MDPIIYNIGGVVFECEPSVGSEVLVSFRWWDDYLSTHSLLTAEEWFVIGEQLEEAALFQHDLLSGEILYTINFFRGEG